MEVCTAGQVWNLFSWLCVHIHMCVGFCAVGWYSLPTPALFPCFYVNLQDPLLPLCFWEGWNLTFTFPGTFDSFPCATEQVGGLGVSHLAAEAPCPDPSVTAGLHLSGCPVPSCRLLLENNEQFRILSISSAIALSVLFTHFWAVLCISCSSHSFKFRNVFPNR